MKWPKAVIRELEFKKGHCGWIYTKTVLPAIENRDFVITFDTR